MFHVQNGHNKHQEDKMTNEEIKHGEKSIKLTVLFHTNGLDNLKMAWVNGKVYATTNKSRGIRPTEDPIPFNKVEQIVPALMKVLKQNGIELVMEEKGKKVILVNKEDYI
jgi:hypothetical protein